MQRQLSLSYSESLAIEDVIPALEGQLDRLPPLSTRNVRVFLSSTFSDMIQERNALMEHVYPRLKKLCREKYRLEFQMIDLRWGLREESQDDHTIIEFCIREIENCKKSSFGPCFVALLGQKYGYRAFPATIEADIFETIREALLCNGKPVGQMETWFKKDENARPPVYILQPISSILKHYTKKEHVELYHRDRKEWDRIFNELLHTLRLGVMLCVEQGKLTKKHRHMFFRSVTEYEIDQGMLLSNDPCNTTFCLTRKIVNLEENVHYKRSAKFIDLVPASTVTSSTQVALESPSAVPAALPPPVVAAKTSVSCNEAETPAIVVTSPTNRYAHGTPLRFLSSPPSPGTLQRSLMTAGGGVVTPPPESPNTASSFGSSLLNLPSSSSSAALPSPNRSPLTVHRTIRNAVDPSALWNFTEAKSPSKSFADSSPFVQEPMVIDRDAQQMLTSLWRDKIAPILPSENVAHFDVEWVDPETSNPTEDVDYLRRFTETFENKMIKLIERAVRRQRSIARHSHVVEILQHLMMCQQRSQVFRGREDILRQIQAYVTSPAKELLVLHGLSGSGKTSIIAKSASLIRQWLTESVPTIIIRFLGTTAQSCSIRLVLSNLCWHLATLAEVDTADIPGDYPALVLYFNNILKQAATESRPIVLFLDSLDQLTSAHRAHNLSWLPKTLPPHVHIVVSTLPYEHDLLDTLRMIVSNESNFIQILPLGHVLSSSLLKEWLRSAGRNLTDAQFNIISDAFMKCSLPLYTRLVFQEVCQWSSYSPPEQTRLLFTVKGIVNKLLDKIERYHGRIFVSHALSYLTSSKNGLSDVELEDVLSLDEEVLNDVFQHWLPPVRRIPPLLLPRLRDELSSYIMQREANGTIVFYWYHRQFIFVAKDRYLSDVGHRIYIHTSLAHYFLGTWGGGKSKPFKYSQTQLSLMSTRRKEADMMDRKVPLQPLVIGSDPLIPGKNVYNLRKLSELPFHLFESRQFLVLKQEVLLNYDWIYAKLSAMSLHDVLSDYRQAIEAGVSTPDISLVFSALRVGGTYVNQNPDTLAFDLLGRLLVYYDKNVHIKELLQQCDAKGVQHSAILPMFQCFESPRAMLLYALEDHTESVIDLLFTPHELISVSKDGTIAFWDLSSGECTRNIDITAVSPGPNTRLYLSGDGQKLVVDSDAINSPVYVYDMKTGQLLHKIGRRLATQRRSFMVGNLLCRQKNIIDVRRGEIISNLDDFVQSRRYVTCCITPDQKKILIGTETVTKLFKFEGGELLGTFPNENLPSVFVITDDSRRAYVGYVEDCLFKVLDIDESSQTFGTVLVMFNYRTAMPNVKFLEGLPQHKELAEIALSPYDNNSVLLNVRRSNLIRYNIANQDAVLIDLKPINATNKTSLFVASFTYSAKFIVVGDERFLHVWLNVDAPRFVCTLNLHSTCGFPIGVSRTRNLVATGSTIHTAVKVWDLDKIDMVDALDVTVYECPIDTMVCSNEKRLVFVKNYSKGYQFVDSFGIDVWNISTGNVVTFLPVARYGKLVQMEVSADGQQMALLLSSRETYIVFINLKTNRTSHIIDVSGCVSMHFSFCWNFMCTSSLHEPVRELRLWNVKTGDLVVCFYQAEKPVFTYDSKFLLYVDSGQTIITYCLQRMAPIRYLACPTDQLMVIPVKHRFVLASKWASSSSSSSSSSAVTNESVDVSKMSSGASPQVTLWNFFEGRQVASLSDVAPGGIRDISSDGKLAVDGFLQVYDLESGRILTELGDECDIGREFTFVRLTYDGLYLIWVDKVSVKARRISDGTLIAHISTHERPTSMCTLDFGYIIVLGREDGRILTMKLLVDVDGAGGSKFPFRPSNAVERTQTLLDRRTCIESAKANFDTVVLTPQQEVKDGEILRAGEHIRSVLSHRAKVPLLTTLTLSKNAGKYSRSYSNLPQTADVIREGSPITVGGSSLAGSPFVKVSPLAQAVDSDTDPCVRDILDQIDIVDDVIADENGATAAATTNGGGASPGPSLPSDSPVILGMVPDKRSQSEINLKTMTLKPPPRGKMTTKHGTLGAMPRHGGGLLGPNGDGTCSSSSSGHLAVLPPRPTTARKLFAPLLNLGASLRAKRNKKSSSRTRSSSDDNSRGRMPSV